VYTVNGKYKRGIFMKKKVTAMLLLVASAFIYSYGSGEEAGKIFKIDRRAGEVHVSTKKGLQLNIGDRLQVETDSGKIVLEVTFPMLTLSKCKIKGKGKLSVLSKGMKVYRYSKDEPAKKEKAGKTEVFGNMEFCYIPGGTYMMGSPETEDGRHIDENQHSVTVSHFWMGRYEVTQKEYRDVMGENPSKFNGNDRLPVENVSWYDVIEFCNRMSNKYGLEPYYKVEKPVLGIFGKDENNQNSEDKIKWTVTITGGTGFRLPTEAEWEYACRAGTTTAFHYGNSLDGSMANFNSWRPYDAVKSSFRGKTTVVGSFSPNAWGLYDMHGNISEWCWDWYKEYYNSSAINDPGGADSGSYRVRRGNSWQNDGHTLVQPIGLLAIARASLPASVLSAPRINSGAGNSILSSRFEIFVRHGGLSIPRYTDVAGTRQP